MPAQSVAAVARIAGLHAGQNFVLWNCHFQYRPKERGIPQTGIDLHLQEGCRRLNLHLKGESALQRLPTQGSQKPRLVNQTRGRHRP